MAVGDKTETGKLIMIFERQAQRKLHRRRKRKKKPAAAAAAPAAAAAKDVAVPDIGADEVEVTEILVKVGDKVEAERSRSPWKATRLPWKSLRRSRAP
ncbi:hypothetical protein M8494_27010 [Serratia ureilytica]